MAAKVVNENGVWYKYICADCGKDTLLESGLGGEMLYCGGRCMRDMHVTDCGKAEITPSEAEAIQSAVD